MLRSTQTKSFLYSLLFFTVLSLVTAYPAYSQILSLQEQLTVELDKRGLDYEEVKEALFLRGYDIENATELTPAQVEEIRGIIQYLIAQKNVKVVEALDSVKMDSLSLAEVIDSTKLSEELAKNEEALEIVPDIYGHDLYRNNQFQLLELSEDLIAPVDYIIGVGDVLVVSIFGRNAQMEQEYRVGNDGAIRINDDRSRIFVSGMSLEEVRKRIIGAFQRFMIFRSDEFSLRLRASRSVRVEIFGEVQNPGTYSMSSINTVFSAIVAAGGPSENASLRHIRLISPDGSVRIFDLYEWLTNPGQVQNKYLDNGDVIHIPVSTRRVDLQGEVRRPMLYDLREDEGIIEVVEYAGGLTSDAYLPNFQLIRRDGIKKIALDISYLEVLRSGRNYLLQDGDQIAVAAISEEIENYVRVSGEVRNAGDFERSQGMRILDLLRKSELKESSKTDVAFLVRRADDGRVSMESIDLDFIIANPGTPLNLLLQNRDELIIYAKDRFVDDEYVVISGAVRFPDTLLYDASNTLKIKDYIVQAGGLTKNATSFAHVHRVNPFNPAQIEYKRVDLERAFNLPNAVDNIDLLAYDSVYVYFKDDFEEQRTINVTGAVNTPSEFTYGNGMTLADAIILAGGFKLSSATNEIEISRVIIKDNQPTTISLQKVRVDRDINDLVRSEDDIALQPFDNIFVREVPEFELQQNVTLEGEVRLPGEYSLIKNNETVYDLIQRAGGITEEAFTAAAQLYRFEDSLGYVVMRLDEVLDNKESIYNYKLKNNDVISIPKKKDYVTIRGATRAIDAVDRNILGPNNEINVPYHKGKNAKYYIDYYAGGFAPRADRKKVFVRHPNGEVRRVERKLLVGSKYPEVRQGSVISVGYKEVDLASNGEDENVDWTKVLGDSIGQAMSILTLILLVERLD